MPIMRCKAGGKPGYKFGKSGKCYTGYGALAKAKKQEAAIRATGWTENAEPGLRGVNTLRLDPSRTKTLRTRFEAEIARRYARVKQRVIYLLTVEDVFGLKDRVHALSSNYVQRRAEQILLNYDPTQPRGKYGRWSRVGGGVSTPSGVGGGTGGEGTMRQLEFDFGVEGPHRWSEVEPLHHSDWKTLEADPRYIYHATNLDNAQSISESLLETHGPSYGTDQEVWPDGSAENRSYFSEEPSTAWMFAPGEGTPVLLRANRTSADFKRESTGDIYTKRSIPPNLLEMATSDGEWVRLSEIVSNLRANTLNKRWEFRSDTAKVKEFEKWIRKTTSEEVISQALADVEWAELDEERKVEAEYQQAIESEAYWRAYLREGMEKGAGRAFDDTRAQARAQEKGGAETLRWYQGTREQFLRDSFLQPETRDKLELLVSRVFTDLKGVNDQMAVQLTREMADGLVKGDNPFTIARNMTNAIDNLTRTRAKVIARTEIIRAHAEGQLVALENMGVDKVGVMVEWHTSGGWITARGYPTPCPLCAPLNGVVLTLKEARGLLPRHPNCLCAFIPANVGEPTEDQLRTRTQIDKAMRASVKAEIPKKQRSKRTIAQQKRRSSWRGAGTRIGKKRPKSILNVAFVYNRLNGLSVNYPGQPRDSHGRFAGGRAFTLAPDVGHPAGGGGITLEIESRSQRAKRTHKPSTAEKQRIAREEQERFAKMIGGENTGKVSITAPFDVRKTKGRVKKKQRYGVEFKCVLDNEKDKLTVHPKSRRRKEGIAKKDRLTTAVVAVDVRGGKRKYYYKPGIGAYRLHAMERVTQAQLKEIFQ